MPPVADAGNLRIAPLEKVRWDFVRQRADEFARPYSAPPIPVLEIAENNGVEVVFSDFGKHSDMVSGLCDFEARKIYVNDNESFGRKMFTIAHEVGHWVLHRQWFEFYQIYMVSCQELALLTRTHLKQKPMCSLLNFVPKHLLFPVKMAGVAQLADIFNVSRKMMENRLKNV